MQVIYSSELGNYKQTLAKCVYRAKKTKKKRDIARG